MSKHNDQSTGQAAGEELWPRRLNKLLIGIGVLAFGLIIADRLINMFQADDLPVVAAIESAPSQPEVAAAAPEEKSVSNTVEPSSLPDSMDEIQAGTVQQPSIEEAFGGPLVFVSTSDPMYVVTRDEKRIDVGARLDNDMTFADITAEGLVLEQAGQSVIINLPEPAQ